ncbi:glycoside hydrolase family 3 protein [Bacillus sp. JJ1474]|uniref:glycoside hydrolase family 3 protein n=1 Tax=Bacillus sp. JJ1474 TaxID=3122955 RepID=UPI002FFEDC0D
MKVRIKKMITSSLAVFLSVSLLLPQVSAEVRGNAQPEMEYRVIGKITVNGKQFKDLNGNKKLDPYENWQLADEVRVKDLVSRMTLEEKAGMLIIPEFPKFTNGKLKLPNKMINQNTRYFIFRESPSADVIAKYNNQLQAAAENTRLGIPAVIISNPRNHSEVPTSSEELDMDKPGQFSFWPATLGLAATRDLNLITEFAQTASKEFRATGIRKLFGYSADVATDPLWLRNDETFGEHPALTSDIIWRIVKGFQGNILNDNSVTTTVRHYPGGGARVKGTDPHFEEGRYNLYPTKGSLLKYHMPPFSAAIAAHTTSIMPYYSYPSNKSAEQGLPHYSATQQFEEVGFALNKQFIDDYLRKELGFLGYVNSDTSAVVDKAWGALNLSVEQRFAKALNAGTNIFSGVTNPAPIINAVKKGLVSEARVNRSVTYLLTEMMKLGLFENPYVDPKKALAVADNPNSQKRADLAHRKSVVLLRNGNNLLPLSDSKIGQIKLYVEAFPGGANGSNTKNLIDKIRKYDAKMTITDRLDDATHAFVWVKPKQYFMKRKPMLTIGPDTGIDNVNRIIEIQKKVPTITAINMRSPWLINEIEPNAAAIMATFGVKTEALVDVIRGRFNPVGKLPFTIPANQTAVDNEIGDIPGFREVPSYVYRNKNGDSYGYDFGLSYQ